MISRYPFFIFKGSFSKYGSFVKSLHIRSVINLIHDLKLVHAGRRYRYVFFNYNKLEKD